MTKPRLGDWRGWRSSAAEGDTRGRGEETEVGLNWMWRLLSPNKVFGVELRRCQMTSSPAVVPGDCLSVYTVYTTYVSVGGLKKTGGPKKKQGAARGVTADHVSHGSVASRCSDSLEGWVYVVHCDQSEQSG